MSIAAGRVGVGVVSAWRHSATKPLVSTRNHIRKRNPNLPTRYYVTNPLHVTKFIGCFLTACNVSRSDTSPVTTPDPDPVLIRRHGVAG